MTNTQTTPAGQVTCRSCGFTHKPEDLIDGQCPRWAEPSDEADQADVPCPTCDGTGYCEFRGEAHRDYDEPNYWDRCGICGGSGWLPASMFVASE